MVFRRDAEGAQEMELKSQRVEGERSAECRNVQDQLANRG